VDAQERDKLGRHRSTKLIILPSCDARPLVYHRDPQALSTAQLCRAGQLATADKTGSPYSITEHRVPELILVLGSQPAGDISHKPGGRLLLLSARPTVTPATLKRAATNFAAW